MKIQISGIKVTERIRKELLMIDELAADIAENGLINPITVMPIANGEYQLLAGLRRLRAVQTLGWTEIYVNSFMPKDAEAALQIELSENAQRIQFTFTEKMEFGRLFEAIEAAKAKERMLSGKSISDPGLERAQGMEDENDHKKYPFGRTNEIVASKLGMSRPTYSRAKYVLKHATPELITQIDNNERTITGVYTELRALKKAKSLIGSLDTPFEEEESTTLSVPEITQLSQPILHVREQPVQTTMPTVHTKAEVKKADSRTELQPKTQTGELATENVVMRDAPNALIPISTPQSKTQSTNVEEKVAPDTSEKSTPNPGRGRPNKPSPLDFMSKKDIEALQKIEAFNALSPEDKIADLERQLREERIRANNAEGDLAEERKRRSNDNYHKDGNIENLRGQIQNLSTLLKEAETALVAANARIKELEDKYEPNKQSA